nr:hypothetical protein [Tanacetum cinerariifolium]
MKCFNCQWECHMARQCPKQKRKKDVTWFRDKVLLVEAQGSGKVLNEEELAILPDPRVVEGPVTQTVITYNAAYKEDDLDAYDSDCCDIATAKAVLEQHYISLELAMQINKENFQNNNTFVNQTKPTFDQLFELNNLKAKLQAKDTTIKNLKANIKRLNKTSTMNSVKKNIDEIETINIELEHKDIVDNAAQVSNATTITTGICKIDPVTLAPKDKNNREAHIYYLKHAMEQAAMLREIVKQVKSLNTLGSASYSACKYELCFLEFVSDMNVCSKSKSIKKTKKKEDWKPTGKVFTKIRYNWRPTGRTFTLVRTVCPLTRITTTNKVPFREPIPLEVVAQEPVVAKVYTRRPKDRIVLNLLKINQKPDNINTRMKIRRKAGSESSLSKNNLTLKLNLSRIQVQGSLLPID